MLTWWFRICFIEKRVLKICHRWGQETGLRIRDHRRINQRPDAGIHNNTIYLFPRIVSDLG